MPTLRPPPTPRADDRVPAIREFLSLRGELEARGFGASLLAPLRELGGPALFRTLVPEGPSFVGFVGCTKVGKSTIFNSLFGEEISPIDWRAHTTRSPIFLFHRPALEQIRRAEVAAGPLLLSDRRTCVVEEHGRLRLQDPAIAYMVPHEKSELANVVLVDLPDANSRAAQLEGDVALEILPWLDLVVFVVTEPTVFDRALDPYVNLRAELGLRSMVVLTRTERQHGGMKDAAFARRVQAMGADRVHVLPAIKGRIFSSRPEFLELREAILAVRDRSPVDALVSSLARTAQGVLQANRERERHLQDLDEALSRAAAGFRARLAFDVRTLVPAEALRLLAIRGLGGFSLVDQLRASPLPEPGRWLELLSLQAWRVRVEYAAEMIERTDLAPAWERARARLEEFNQLFLATWRTAPYAADLAEAGAPGPGPFDPAEFAPEAPFTSAVRSCLAALCALLRDPRRRPGVRIEAVVWPLAALLAFFNPAPDLTVVIAVAAWLRILLPEIARPLLEPEHELRCRVCSEQVLALMAEPLERMVEHYQPERFSQMVLREEEREYQVLRRIAALEEEAGA